MNRRIPFEKNELKAVGSIPGMFGGPDTPIRNTPVTPKENVAALYFDKHPYWVVTPGDSGLFFPDIYSNNLGRGGWNSGTTDVFGLVWEYIPAVGGSIVRPGEPLLKDANEWKEKIVIPDIDKWDWAKAAEDNKLDTRFFNQLALVNGFWFERLISFMDFAPAAMALIDEDQKDAVKSLFEAMTDLAIKVVDKVCEYWPAVDGFSIHDDWGSQKAPFFSEEIAYEFFVPYMKELTDHIHSKGRVATLHSCGHVEDRVKCFIDGGFDQWTPQAMNDTHRLYDEVGDKIVIAVIPDPFDPATTPEDEQRERARAFVDRFCKPGKSAIMDFYSMGVMTPVFSDELYEYSRKKYAGF